MALSNAQHIRALALDTAARLMASDAYTTGSGGQRLQFDSADVLTLAKTFAEYIERAPQQEEMRRAW